VSTNEHHRALDEIYWSGLPPPEIARGLERLYCGCFDCRVMRGAVERCLAIPELMANVIEFPEYLDPLDAELIDG
jgi:hypothetical protein